MDKVQEHINDVLLNKLYFEQKSDYPGREQNLWSYPFTKREMNVMWETSHQSTLHEYVRTILLVGLTSVENGICAHPKQFVNSYFFFSFSSNR